jgi:hypothetical protein
MGCRVTLCNKDISVVCLYDVGGTFETFGDALSSSVVTSVQLLVGLAELWTRDLSAMGC